MAPSIQVGAGGRVVKAEEGPVLHLIVVPLISDTTASRLELQVIDIASGAPAGKVLAVATTALGPIIRLDFIYPFQNVHSQIIDLHVVSENAALGNRLGISGKSSIPSQIGSRVVGTVNVVLVDNDGAVVVSRGGSRSRRGGGSRLRGGSSRLRRRRRRRRRLGRRLGDDNLGGR